jgi:hypothetical protein
MCVDDTGYCGLYSVCCWVPLGVEEQKIIILRRGWDNVSGGVGVVVARLK